MKAKAIALAVLAFAAWHHHEWLKTATDDQIRSEQESMVLDREDDAP